MQERTAHEILLGGSLSVEDILSQLATHLEELEKVGNDTKNIASIAL